MVPGVDPGNGVNQQIPAKARSVMLSSSQSSYRYVNPSNPGLSARPKGRVSLNRVLSQVRPLSPAQLPPCSLGLQGDCCRFARERALNFEYIPVTGLPFIYFIIIFQFLSIY